MPRPITPFVNPDSSALAPTARPQVIEEIEDAQLETRIRRNLLRLIGPAAFNIGVVASGGMVILSGRVPAPRHERRALHITRAIYGVEEVHDLIQVRPPANAGRAVKPAAAPE